MNILHILTLNGKNGEYGGPVRVARETCLELKGRGHHVEIFSGALRGLEPVSYSEIEENFIIVKPLSQRFPLSSLWNWNLIPNMWHRIRNSDVVHIHFARDLIPILATVICILTRKKYVTQTHGMVVPDNRIVIKFIDHFITIPILEKSSTNFVLTDFELQRMKLISEKINFRILPNGISTNMKIANKPKSNQPVVAFCSRLHPQKRLDKFLAMAEAQVSNQYRFVIYGSDGGELVKLESYLKSKETQVEISYLGALDPSDVGTVLSQVDLLVLPSDGDNFPMVILEALSVGTPVLIMQSCGIASRVAKYNEHFVCAGDSLEDLFKAFSVLGPRLPLIDRNDVRKFCMIEFAIERVCDSLIATYIEVVEKTN